MTPLEACKTALPLVESVAGQLPQGGADAEALADVGIILRNAINEARRVRADLLAALQVLDAQRARVDRAMLVRAGIEVLPGDDKPPNADEMSDAIATLLDAIGGHA